MMNCNESFHPTSYNTDGAKSYDRVCSDPAVFGEMLGLAAVTKWKIPKHTAGEFHWQAIIGDIFLSARCVYCIRISFSLSSRKWNRYLRLHLMESVTVRYQPTRV